jgi:hypothetical protein
MHNIASIMLDFTDSCHYCTNILYQDVLVPLIQNMATQHLPTLLRQSPRVRKSWLLSFYRPCQHQQYRELSASCWSTRQRPSCDWEDIVCTCCNLSSAKPHNAPTFFSCNLLFSPIEKWSHVATSLQSKLNHQPQELPCVGACQTMLCTWHCYFLLLCSWSWTSWI